jgi:hypothetical protein
VAGEHDELAVTVDPLSRIADIRGRLNKAFFGRHGIMVHGATPLIKDDMPWLLDTLEQALKDLEHLRKIGV